MLKNTSNPIILGLFLGLIGAISAILLSTVADFTKDPIKKNELAVISKALQNVMPEFNNVPSEDTITVKAADNPNIDVVFFGGKKDGKLIAVAGQTYSTKGYAGRIDILAGIKLDGTIRTVLVTKQNETPGLGTVVCDRKNVVTIFDLFGMGKQKEVLGLPKNPILDQFEGHSASKKDEWKTQPWKVLKDGGQAQFMTGATITSRAVTEAVYRITKTYLKNKKEIIAKLNQKKTAEKSK